MRGSRRFVHVLDECDHKQPRAFFTHRHRSMGYVNFREAVRANILTPETVVGVTRSQQQLPEPSTKWHQYENYSAWGLTYCDVIFITFGRRQVDRLLE